MDAVYISVYVLYLAEIVEISASAITRLVRIYTCHDSSDEESCLAVNSQRSKQVSTVSLSTPNHL